MALLRPVDHLELPDRRLCPGQGPMPLDPAFETTQTPMPDGRPCRTRSLAIREWGPGTAASATDLNRAGRSKLVPEDGRIVMRLLFWALEYPTSCVSFITELRYVELSVQWSRATRVNKNKLHV